MKYFIRTNESTVADFEAHFSTTLNPTLRRILGDKPDALLTATVQPDGAVRTGWLEGYDEDWALEHGYVLMSFKAKEMTPREVFKEQAEKLGGGFKFTSMKVDGGVDLKYIAWAKKSIVVYHGDGAAQVVRRVTEGKKKLAARFITLEQFLSQ